MSCRVAVAALFWPSLWNQKAVMFLGFASISIDEPLLVQLGSAREVRRARRKPLPLEVAVVGLLGQCRGC